MYGKNFIRVSDQASNKGGHDANESIDDLEASHLGATDLLSSPFGLNFVHADYCYTFSGRMESYFPGLCYPYIVAFPWHACSTPACLTSMYCQCTFVAEH